LAAKKIKEEMLGFKLKVTDVVNNLYDFDQNLLKAIKSDIVLKHKIEELGFLGGSSDVLENSQGKTSRLKEDLELLKE